MGNDDLAFLQELIGNADTFAEQAAGVLAQVENKTLHIAHFVERLGDLMLSGLLEAGNVHVTDPGADEEMEVDAVAGNLVTDDGEFERLIGALAEDSDAHRGSLGPFEQLGNFRRTEVVRRLAIDRHNDVAGMNARAVGRRTHKRSYDNDLVVARADGHADAVILAALCYPKQGIGLGIEEIGMGIEGVEHARDGTVVDRFVRVYRLSIVLLDDVINLGEGVETVADVSIASCGGGSNPLTKEHSQETTSYEDQNYEEKRATSATNHLESLKGVSSSGVTGTPRPNVAAVYHAAPAPKSGKLRALVTLWAWYQVISTPLYDAATIGEG